MTQAVTLAQLGGADTPFFRNRIINGAMVIDQRNAGASVTAANQYSLDRWCVFNSQSSKFTFQQNAGSVTPPVGFTNYLGLTSSSAYSITAGDYFGIYQRIEGFNTADLAWGTANASPVTLSFWVRSSLTGTFGGALRNDSSNRGYPFTYTISSANTWEQKSVTIAGDTSGTWGTTNGTGISVQFSIGTGSTYSFTAGAWGSHSSAISATGATSVVGTNGATFYITGVQLESGTQATPFERRPYGTELALCQRYFELFGHGGAGKAGSGTVNAEMAFTFQVTKRAAPSIAYVGSSSNTYLTECGVATRYVSSIAGTSTGVNGAYVNSQTTVNGTGGVVISFPSGIAPWLSASAEL